ncbi:MAG: single-stranded DNA-binding protein [Phormidesmis sp. RL_2_1]|nr:single-stranded DNA-binding protein [Phormidesmis sp. RL_2_1]
MNNCILMAEIIQAPQLRYTADTQTPIAEFVVKFPGLREQDASGQLKVLGWGNLAQEIQERYQAGDRVLLEGRLGTHTVERPEGFKEKRVEMTVQRVSPIDELQSVAIAEPTPIATGKFVATGTGASSSSPVASTPSAATAATAATGASASSANAETPGLDYDDIPF